MLSPVVAKAVDSLIKLGDRIESAEQGTFRIGLRLTGDSLSLIVYRILSPCY